MSKKRVNIFEVGRCVECGKKMEREDSNVCMVCLEKILTEQPDLGKVIVCGG